MQQSVFRSIGWVVSYQIEPCGTKSLSGMPEMRDEDSIREPQKQNAYRTDSKSMPKSFDLINLKFTRKALKVSRFNDRKGLKNLYLR